MNTDCKKFDIHIPITYYKINSIGNDETNNVSLCNSSNEPPCISFQTKLTANPAYIIAKTSTSSTTTGTVYTKVLTKFPNRNILTSADECIISHKISSAKDPERIGSTMLNVLITLEDDKHKYKKEEGC